MTWPAVAWWTAVAVYLWFPPATQAAQRWSTVPTAEAMTETPRGRALMAVATVTVVAMVIAGGGAAALVLAAALLVFTVGAVTQGRVRARRAGRDRVAVAQACAALSSEVAAGRSPTVALREVAAEWPVLAEGAAHVAMGGDPVAVWRRASSRPGLSGLAELAATWDVCVVTGAPMGPSLDRVAESLQQDRELRALVNQELAAARATGRLMAGLPVIGLLLGYAMGGDPVGFLVSSLWGQGCLVVGVGLACLGLWWTEKMADRAGTW